MTLTARIVLEDNMAKCSENRRIIAQALLWAAALLLSALLLDEGEPRRQMLLLLTTLSSAALVTGRGNPRRRPCGSRPDSGKSVDHDI